MTLVTSFSVRRLICRSRWLRCSALRLIWFWRISTKVVSSTASSPSTTASRGNG